MKLELLNPDQIDEYGTLPLSHRTGTPVNYGNWPNAGDI
jgi:hypothetical protein